MILVEHTVEHRNHCGLPVVAVNDVRLPVQSRQDLQHGTAEKDKAFAVIIEAVHAVPHEVIGVVQQIVGDLAHLNGIDTAVLFPPADLNGDVLEICHLVADVGSDTAVQRHHNPTVDVVMFAQGSRQRTGNIGKPAGSGKGQGFTGCK